MVEAVVWRRGNVGSRQALMSFRLSLWFLSVAISAVYVAYDLLVRTPEMKVMKWGWILVTLYLGPFAFVVYWFSCREPQPGSHEKFVAPIWKQAVGSTIHCLAGDATGIIGAAAITSSLGLNMGKDLLVEYVAGFSFGLLIFQALFMKDMLGGTYLLAVRKTVFAEWISMNAVMAGMVPLMVFFMSRNMQAMEPRNGEFWASMSAATLAGAVLAFPFNWWLVKNNLKHGMGTKRALGRGGAQREESKMDMASTHGTTGMQAMETHVRPASTRNKILVALLSLALLVEGAWIATRYTDLNLNIDQDHQNMRM